MSYPDPHGKVLLLYSGVPSGQCVFADIREFIAHLRETADTLEAYLETYNTVMMTLNAQGFDQMRGLSETYAEIVERQS